MKPNTRIAIYNLIHQARELLPFDLTEEQLCTDHCLCCRKKLLEFVEIRIIDWEKRLGNNETPKLGEVTKFARTINKVYLALTKEHLN